jgi:hypothetical protein
MDQQEMLELAERIAKGELTKEMERLAMKSRQHSERAEQLYDAGQREDAYKEATMSIMYSNAALMLQNATIMLFGNK